MPDLPSTTVLDESDAICAAARERNRISGDLLRMAGQLERGGHDVLAVQLRAVAQKAAALEPDGAAVRVFELEAELERYRNRQSALMACLREFGEMAGSGDVVEELLARVEL